MTTLTPLADGSILIAGGTDNNLDEYGATYLLPWDGSPAQIGSALNTPRFQHGAVRLLDGRVVVAGGRSGVPATNENNAENL